MRVNRFFLYLIIGLATFGVSAFADDIEYTVSGVNEPVLSNVFNHVRAFRIGSGAVLNARLRRQLARDTKIATENAMRPYGYFHPRVSVEIKPAGESKWEIAVVINAGPPVLVQDLYLELTGPGSELEALAKWYRQFPLTVGKVLDQQSWTRAKQNAINLLEEEGYLQAGFSKHSIRVNPSANTARLELVVNTGPQTVLGKVVFNQDFLNDGVLASLQRFEHGDPYNTWLLEKFRLDLWRSGYFEQVEVVERRKLTSEPPIVDLEVNFVPRKKNTYQGTLGYGTDTEARFQFRWNRHLLSARGDNLETALGWQQRDNEFSFQTSYRLPRETRTQQFWLATLGFKSEKQSLVIASDTDIEDRTTIARGNIDDYYLRPGRTRVLNMQNGFRQIFETVFIQYLHEERDFDPSGNVPEGSPVQGAFADLLKSNYNSFAVGVEWDWPEIRGTGFETRGHHERAWLFTSNEAWGSDQDFSQVYISSRWNRLLGSNWKFLFRAEAGYSDATTNNVAIPATDEEISISASDLPYLYRFKAGGSRSVRGYAFEHLDDNGLGSNNILTASAEIEYRFHETWSAAAFIDVGNAFNDWSRPSLKTGSGFGLRWYSLIGALSLDVAQGWDLEGDPWRVHLTIGTPLL
jgi:translocation and assembly module TamA